MKKILLFTDSLGAGGAQRQLIGLAVFLKEKEYKVKVCTYHNLDFYISFLDENKVSYELIPGADDRKKRIWSVRQYFKLEKPDWVIAYQETPSLVASAAKLLGCNYKLIVSERNTTQKLEINERVRFFLYRWADAIVPNSYAQNDFLSLHYPWMKSKLRPITNFVNLQHFNFEKRKRRLVPEIAIVATIWFPKNTLGFIEAIKILVANGCKFHISWYGKSLLNIEYFNQCQQKIEQYELQDYIFLKEKTKQIKQVYNECDFFCLPSFYEGTPNVICEAMSCGRPIICSKVCDNPVYVAESENGFLFDPKNSQSIADAIERALKVTNEEYSHLCKQSRTKAEHLLSEITFRDKYIEIIESK